MYTHDSLWHIERIQNMSSLLPAQFPVRWSPSLDNGYGVPLFNFTYPLPYYFGAGLMAIGLGPIKSYNLIILVSYLLGGVGVYFLGSKKPWVGLVAAVLYLTMPYQFLDIFVRGALGEVVALGIIPWIFLAIGQISTDGKLRWYSSLPFALLIISHNFYAYLFGALLAFCVAVIYRHKLAIMVSLLISLGLSAFFWLPALLEKNYLLFSASAQNGYRDHYVYFTQLFSSQWSYLGSQAGLDPQEMSYSLGISTIIVILVAIYVAVKTRAKRLGSYLFPLLVSIFLMLPASDFLWQHLPLLASIQFPWRFLGVVAVLIPLIYLEIADHYAKASNFRLFSFVLIIVGILGITRYGRPVKWLSAEEFYNLHYEYVGKTTTAAREEIVPRWAVTERYQPPSPLLISDSSPVSDLSQQDLGISFRADSASSEGAIAVYHRNYYPMWQLLVDGQFSPIGPTSTGEITFPLRSGDHHYELRVGSTQVQKLGNWISLLFIFGAAFYFGRPNKHQTA